jgi:maleylpyruvate isomerase
VRALAELVNSGIQPLQNTSTFAELKKHGVDTEAWARLFIAKGLEALEQLAAPRAGAFLFGDTVSLADVYLVPQLYNARRYHVPLDSYPTLTRADESARALPAFRDAAPEAQPDAEPLA